MKLRLPFKLIICLGISGAFFLACSSDDEDSEVSREPFFNFSTRYFDEGILKNETDSIKIDIETNSYWNIEKESDLDWVSIQPSKGTGSGESTIQVKDNKTVGDRSAWIYLNAFEFKDSIEVKQRGRELSISKEAFTDVNGEATDLEFTLEAIEKWVSNKGDNADWLTLDPKSGDAGEHEIKLSLKENPTDTTRMDSISFMLANQNAIEKVWLHVSQNAKEKVEPKLTLESSQKTVEAIKGSVELSLTTNIDWQATSDIDGVTLTPNEGTKSDEVQKITVEYPANTTTEKRNIEISFSGKEPNEEVTATYTIEQLGQTASEIAVKNNIVEIDGKNQVFEIELTSSNVDWKAVSKDSRFTVIENESGMATVTPVLIKVNATENMSFESVSGAIEIQKADDPEVKTEVAIKQGLHPMNDESLVYTTPSQTASQIGLDRGVAHPSQENWEFWNAHEFTDNATGFWNFNTKGGIENAVFNGDMKVVKDGTLKIKTRKLASPTTNIHGDAAEYETASLYSKRHHQGGVKWVKFTTSMRVEVRYKSSGHQGFNEALWFMGQSNFDGQGIPWPDSGEIDLMESPFKNQAHFSLHTENFSAKTGNAETASINIPDETKWNIFWVEILEDRIIGGINGFQYFEHIKGEGGNNDWPWDNPAGMMMIITPGIGGWSGEMPNMSAGEEAFMELDWIRVYTNDKFDASSQTGHDGKFY
ncbi:Putative binding domain-containing protein, N-terminal [Salegentibacter holothuriorum]|uniref:Putative binding domain-containing protein, N-terminal n=1 Tax=Salegentibacter holothuriorum TaxID=241145 RepID=A0A1T5DK93_9FLAO|nr:BACON domain-containing carbohydrate-binding protein [Salegentibacter holothuriorum]SKB71863.1 Putative binding domain-containing protein, N-terminal [Salegentibacter holothuriorum]